MALTTCWRCLARYKYGHSRTVLQLKPSSISLLTSQRSVAAFTTSINLSYPAPPKAKRPERGPPKRGEKTFVIKKKKRGPETKGRPPEPGDRRTLRKRIILSNTNALEVQGMQDLTIESMVDTQNQDMVIGIPNPVVDQLRAVGAFKVSQSWGLFRRPAMLIRKETVEYGKLITSISTGGGKASSSVRRIIVGEKSSGKSTLLLQAMSAAFLKNWVVINIPDAMDLINGHTEYSPIPSISPPQYFQKVYLSNLLSTIVRANPVLSTLQISLSHTLPTPLQPNISLSRLALLGADDPSLAFPIFNALLLELLSPSTPEHPRPPLLLALDNLAHAMKNSTYLSSSFQPIHAHDLSLIRFFTDHLSGKSSLPNGGLVLAATSGSNTPNVPTLTFQLSRLEALQSPPPPFQTANDPNTPFLLSTGQTPSHIPQPNPFAAYDTRVMHVLSDHNAVQVQRLPGLTKSEAMALMEYWARSGILRGAVSERLVGEKWTISGGGVVGELERGCVGMRV